jgi:hypothetical protein
MKLNTPLLHALPLFSVSHAAANCSTLTFTTLLSENSATITFVQTLASNASFSPPGGLMGPMGLPKGSRGPPKEMPIGPRALRVPSLCVLQAKIKSSETSEYSFGVFLPEKWNGRFL